MKILKMDKNKIETQNFSDDKAVIPCCDKLLYVMTTPHKIETCYYCGATRPITRIWKNDKWINIENQNK